MDFNKETLEQSENRIALYRQEQITIKEKDKQLKTDAVKLSLILVMDRLNDTSLNALRCTTDIIDIFGRMPLENIKLAIKNGSTGKYGRTYKLTTQEVCYWIREFIKEDVKSREL